MGNARRILALLLAACLTAAAAAPAEVSAKEQSGEIIVDPEDPGNYRLGGNDADESGISTMAVSNPPNPAKYQDCIRQKGIDVSYHNGTIDWTKVQNDGIKYAIIRAAYRGYENGRLATDTEALENLRNASQAGVLVGAYIFSQAVNVSEAVSEADYLISVVEKAGIRPQLPLVLDFEYVSVGVGRLYKAKLSKAEATDICNAFCGRVRERGYQPMVYANKSMLQDEVYAGEVSQSYPIWLAHYSKGATDYGGQYDYWQYSDSGRVDGIKDKYVDFNYRYINSLTITGRTADSLSMQWDAWENAESYNIFRGSGENYQLYRSGITDTVFTDTGLAAGTDYSYKVYPIVGGAQQSCIGFNTGITAYSGTTVLTGKGKAFDKVKLTWQKAAGATRYQLQLYDSAKQKWSTVKNVGGSSSGYTDGNKNANKAYKYRVRPFREVFNARMFGEFSQTIKVKTKKARKGKTKSRKLVLRKKASNSSKKLGTIKKKGTKVTVSGSSGSWYRVKVKIGKKKKTGYLKKKKVRLL